MDTTTNVWDRLLHHIKLFLDLSDEKNKRRGSVN